MIIFIIIKKIKTPIYFYFIFVSCTYMLTGPWNQFLLDGFFSSLSNYCNFEKVTLKDTFPPKSALKVGFECESASLIYWNTSKRWNEVLSYSVTGWMANPWLVCLGLVTLSSSYTSSRLMGPALIVYPCFSPYTADGRLPNALASASPLDWVTRCYFMVAFKVTKPFNTV